MGTASAYSSPRFLATKLPSHKAAGFCVRQLYWLYGRVCRVDGYGQFVNRDYDGDGRRDRVYRANIGLMICAPIGLSLETAM